MNTIATLLQSGKHIISLIGLARDAAKKLDNYEIIAKLSELQAEFMELQQQQAELINENMELREKNRALADSLRIRDELEYHYNAYWIRKGDSLDGPFDSTEWDQNRKLVRLYLVSVKRGTAEVPRYQFASERQGSISAYVPLEFLQAHSVNVEGTEYLDDIRKRLI